jgi:hypothetical protein
MVIVGTLGQQHLRGHTEGRWPVNNPNPVSNPGRGGGGVGGRRKRELKRELEEPGGTCFDCDGIGFWRWWKRLAVP